MNSNSKGRAVCILWRWNQALRWEGDIPSGGDGKMSGSLAPGTIAFIWALKNADLYLMGAIRVGSSTSDKMRGKSIHGLFRLVALGEQKWKLRFESSHDRLNENFQLALQVRARRWLTPESAQLLHNILESSQEEDEKLAEDEFINEAKYAERTGLTRIANPKLRILALRKYGFACQVCGLDFVTKYGTFAKHCVEVHHITPRSQTKEGVSTGLRDVAILCPNCHRAFHRWPAKSSYLLFKKFIQARMNFA